MTNLATHEQQTLGGGHKLRELPFMDLYVRLDDGGMGSARYRTPGRDYSNNWSRPLPDIYHAECRQIAQELRLLINSPDTSYEYDGVRFRISYQKLANNQEWTILRRINSRVFTLEELSLAPQIIEHLRKLGKRDGLIMVSGPTGHGKTTTSFALFADYMRRFGGVGISIEDPVEYNLDGPVGDYGYCYQVQVGNDEDWATPLKRALRWTPRYLLVGEVRSPRAAEQILRAATTGHLVITTIHAGSVEESLMGLMHLAEQSIGGAANHMLAQGLTAAWHQTLTATGPYLRYIFTEENNNGDPVRALIRENKVGMINSYIDKQAAQLKIFRGIDPVGRLAHQLLPLLASSAHPIITFMAAVSGEGTSTIALAFAESLVAQHDQKVLLISANTKLNAGKVAGLVDMCAAGQNTGEIFSDNTNRVTHATWVANPVHRSLAGKYVRDAGFWQKLRAQFDTIIIDAPSL